MTNTEQLFEKSDGGHYRTSPRSRMASAIQNISESRAKKITSARKLVPHLVRKYSNSKDFIAAEMRPRTDGDFDVVFKGGKNGEASILASMSTTSRIIAHWNGYLQYNGIHPYTVGDVVGFYGPYSRGLKTASHRSGRVTKVTPTALSVTYHPITMPGAKRIKTLKMREVWLLHAARPKQEIT
jgi:hypothetical protein